MQSWVEFGMAGQEIGGCASDYTAACSMGGEKRTSVVDFQKLEMKGFWGCLYGEFTVPIMTMLLCSCGLMVSAIVCSSRQGVCAGCCS